VHVIAGNIINLGTANTLKYNQRNMNNPIPRVPPPAFCLAAIIIMLLFDHFIPLGIWLDYPWRYLGIILIVAGFCFGLGCGVLFRKLGTNLKPGAKATLVVQGGPFRFTRNPMYLSLNIILIGVAILFGTFSPLIIIPVFFLFLHTQFVLREEKLMEEWFGDSYLEYKSKTPRWLW
jgi:protein-S-isoprenylcysteine O-methyltransferase Ste14